MVISRGDTVQLGTDLSVNIAVAGCHAAGFMTGVTCALTVYPRRARSALGVDTVLTLDVCMYVRALERKRLIGMT